MDRDAKVLSKILTNNIEREIHHDQPSPTAQAVKILPALQQTQKTWFSSWVGKIPWRRKWQPTLVYLPG